MLKDMLIKKRRKTVLGINYQNTFKNWQQKWKPVLILQWFHIKYNEHF